jgi:hypothetical protein
MSLLARFGHEQDGNLHPDHLQWPGSAAGFPVLGGAPTLAKESETRNLEHVAVFQARLFRMWLKDDLEDYKKVMERAVNGWFTIRVNERRWDETKNDMMIWLEWSQIYGVAPKSDTLELVTTRRVTTLEGRYGRPDQVFGG